MKTPRMPIGDLVSNPMQTVSGHFHWFQTTTSNILEDDVVWDKIWDE
eukprot:CAMPEP_0170337458 /NCGR_PEP_ID=MMETSP0116_2-20130129/69775_1 /TAXON_ID=400756 /ORGANISM="Durinskia baltica, Strain CSIRO CS-38" /LENGTH=46 /DNA_ID= /DNA_START= /DNA_END= /DNA_ORIENTATION=